ncbi:helix-turn-helix transcriptional regulator [Nitrospirillum sp. BR 11164]|uniref:helix-turn-helix domain-containing protein n=1 Tax=Nitrospirillum sp. BR 11164 TaxID=3104324 RepID=UPI002AFF79F6|nr:helix-turn-helix transcriptional regulator [Nitrospirillum sp. BR 11164]MEA1648413.1 helix-turn-helix transcriptional regulator [Nitrospirillum sp. BR 11164]
MTSDNRRIGKLTKQNPYFNADSSDITAYKSVPTTPFSAHHASMDVRTRVAMRIKAIRKRRGLSQEALAALIDRSPDAISNLERGVSTPAYDTLDLLAKGLGVPLAEFFVEEGDDPRRTEAMARLNDAARQLDSRRLATAAAIVELLAAEPFKEA